MFIINFIYLKNYKLNNMKENLEIKLPNIEKLDLYSDFKLYNEFNNKKIISSNYILGLYLLSENKNSNLDKFLIEFDSPISPEEELIFKNKRLFSTKSRFEKVKFDQGIEYDLNKVTNNFNSNYFFQKINPNQNLKQIEELYNNNNNNNNNKSDSNKNILNIISSFFEVEKYIKNDINKNFDNKFHFIEKLEYKILNSKQIDYINFLEFDLTDFIKSKNKLNYTYRLQSNSKPIILGEMSFKLF